MVREAVHTSNASTGSNGFHVLSKRYVSFTHRMSFHSFVREIKVSGHGDPLERFTAEISPDGFVVGTKLMVIGRGCSFFAPTSFIILLIRVLLGDDDVVKSFEGVGRGGILVIYEVLFL